MNHQQPHNYWKSLAQRDGSLPAPPAEHAGFSPGRDDWSAVNRRQFLEAAGFTLGLVTLGGCGPAPTRVALPLVVQPEGMIPGRTRSYASTCGGCSAACGLLVAVRDGRPLKMEGMPEHPLSRGGLCATGQALPLGLYDSHRLRHPLQAGKPASWADVDRALMSRLEAIAGKGEAVRFVTSTVTSPTLQAMLDAFLSRFANARHVTWDALSCSAILDAHERTHSARVLPHYRLERARVIAAFGADFLGTWISPVEFTAAWSSRRRPTVEHAEMSYHAQFEGRMSLTGGNADKRYRLAPEDYGVVLSHLASQVSELSGQSPPPGSQGRSPLDESELAALAERLWAARGECLILCDSQDVSVQLLVNFLNHTLGNYGHTLDILRPSRQKQGNDRDLLELVEELKAGKVSALFVAGTDLTHNLPGRAALAKAIGDVELVVSFAEREDDFTSLADFVCPEPHPLEAWMDAEPVNGLASLSQPTLAPLGETRPLVESLARWSGRAESAYEILRTHWKSVMLSRVPSQAFESWWDTVVHDGFVALEANPVAVTEFQAEGVELLGNPPIEQGYTLLLHAKVGMTDSRHAHNPWLQELPDPITKVTWDNHVSVSSSVARTLDVTDGDMLRVESRSGDFMVELPAFVQPGQHDRVLAISLGYGVRGTDRFARIGPRWLEARPTVAPGKLVGTNVAGFLEAKEGTLRYARSGVSVTRTGRRHELATTQEYHSLAIPPQVAPHGATVRDQIQETSLSAFVKNPRAGTPAEHAQEAPQLWADDHPTPGHAWGMVIDLNACTGCSACLIACQSENNVPVVGKDEVRRQREMHWIRVDRYYSGDGDDVAVAFQPMMCQHCGNAPCETVCPVLATVHSDEGLNEQVYNRCVGTRYCANNCPYKVRRFNWFAYAHEDELRNLALNPDVTVRTRGVMEKCSLCVQRIEEGKIASRRRGESVADGSIQTACQQSCPARAIEFGDLRDPTSRVHAALENPRRYRVLEEFNFRPSVAYLRMVRNDGTEHAEEASHG